jgi:hypothetical protein
VLAHGPPGPARAVFESPTRAGPGRKKARPARADPCGLVRTRKARAGPGQPPGFFYKSNLLFPLIFELLITLPSVEVKDLSIFIKSIFKELI